MVEAGSVWGFLDAEASSGVALGVGVDDEDPEIIGSEGSCKVDGGGGFPYSAFLVSNGENSAQAGMVSKSEKHKPRMGHEWTWIDTVSRETGDSLANCFT